MTYILLYSTVMITLVVCCERGRRQSKEHFLAADRSVGGPFGAMSIAASWIWAPALFVSTQVGYQWGYSGLFWFTVPNVLALVFFAPFAAMVRNRIPFGFSYIGYLQERAPSFRRSQLGIQMLLQIVSFAIQVTAGAELLSMVSGTPYTTLVWLMTLTPLAYSLISGLASSVLTDALQFLLIVAAIVIIYCGIPLHTELALPDQIVFQPFDPNTLLQFGIASALALTVGIFADQQQWQRAFAIQQDRVARTYIAGGLLHGCVTFSLGSLGVLLAVNGFQSNRVQLVGAEFIAGNMPSLYSVIFVCMALCGLCSTLDSCFCAFGSLYSTEVSGSKNKVRASRKAMVALAIIGLTIGFLRVPIITLWLTAGVLRLSSVTPILLSVLREDFSCRIGTRAIYAGIFLGTPLFAYGSVTGNHLCRTVGMLLCLGVSTALCFLPDLLHRTAVKNRLRRIKPVNNCSN